MRTASIGQVLCLVLGAMLAPAVSRAQDPVHRRYTMKDGLPSNKVYSIIQDRMGFIWFGTDAGTSRFDGRYFVNFTLSDGLPDQEVIRVVEDSKGRIWFLTLNGRLSYYHEGRIHNERTDPGLGSEHHASGWQCLVEDVRGGIWFGGVYGGLLRLHPDLSVDTLYEWPNGIISLAHDEKDSIVVFQSAIIHRINGRTTEMVGVLDSMLYMSMVPDRLDPSRKVLVLMNDGIYERRSDGSRPLIPDADLDDLFHRSAWEDNEGSVWVHRRKAGIDLHRAHEGRFMPVLTLFPDDNVNHALVDRNGIRWMGTDKGVIMFSKAQESARTHLPPGTHEGLLSLFVDRHDRLWAGGEGGGLYRFGTAGLERIEAPMGSAGLGRVLRMDENDEGLWIATDHSLIHVDPSSTGPVAQAMRFDHEYYGWVGKKKESARSVLCCRDGRVLCGGTGLHELKRTEKGRVRRFVMPDVVPFVRVYALHEDVEGRIWFENGEKLFALVNEELRTFPELSGSTGLRITDITTYQGDTLLLATTGAGLLMVHEGRVVHRVDEGAEHHLSDVKRVRVCGDTIWTAGIGGVHAFVKDGMGLRCCRTITEREGLPSSDARDVVIWQGRPVIATSQGVTVVDRDPMGKPTTVPIAYFHSVMVGDSTRPIGEAVVMGPGEGPLRVAVRSIAFFNPELIRYQYRMLPEEKWSDMPEGSIDYANLEAGSYTLEVRTRMADAAWTHPISFPVQVVPPWYLMEWAFLLFAVISIASITIVVGLMLRGRHRRELRRFAEIQLLNEERRRIAADVHDDLGADLSHLLMEARAAMEPDGTSVDPASASRLVDGLGKSVEKIDEIIWSLDPGRDDLRSTADFIESWVRGYVHGHGLRFTSDLSFADHDRALHAVQRRELALVVKECVRNIIKHAGAGHVHLSVRLDGGDLRIVVEDDGIRSPNDQYNGERNGLANMRRRMERMHGKLGMERRMPQGTRFSIQLLVAEGSSEMVMRKPTSPPTFPS